MNTSDDTPDCETADDLSERSDPRSGDKALTCAEEGCMDRTTVELHVPWGENRFVCAGHARVASQQDGIVADPLESASESADDGVNSGND